MSNEPIIVVGAGQSGLQIVDSLRRGGYQEGLVLIGDESLPPYQRPPLSKQFMGGDMADERLLFRPRDYYEKQNVELLLETSVEAVDTTARTVTLADGTRRVYHKLALATGATVRRLTVPGGDLDGVCYLRSVADAHGIRARLDGGAKRLVAIGGGFIGLEMAAAAREAGHAVTVLEALERLMARAVAPPISDYYLRLHRERGVEVLLETTLDRIDVGEDGGLNLRLGDGTMLEADLVVAGIGSVPHDELAEAAGLVCDNGIVVDEFARTSDPDVVAAGDCTMHNNVRFAGHHRLESVQNAVDQAKIAAASLLGEPKAYDQVPWFWSDQFDAKLQMVGTSAGHDRYVVRGAPEEGAFSVFYLTGDRLIGVESVNRPADHLVSRKLLAAGTVVPDDVLKDVEQNLKALL